MSADVVVAKFWSNGKALSHIECVKCHKITAADFYYVKKKSGVGLCMSCKQTGLRLGKPNLKRRRGKSVECPTCGKVRWVRICELGPVNYCSRECHAGSAEVRTKRSESLKKAWSESRSRMMEGIQRRSQSASWRAAEHFQKGEKHPAWKGGKSRLRGIESCRYQYVVWRKSVMRRDGYSCRDCGVVGGRLVAHHDVPWSENESLRYEISNGVTLCESCHDKRHGWSKSPKTSKCDVCGSRKPRNKSSICKGCHMRKMNQLNKDARDAKSVS